MYTCWAYTLIEKRKVSIDPRYSRGCDYKWLVHSCQQTDQIKLRAPIKQQSDQAPSSQKLLKKCLTESGKMIKLIA